MVMNNVGLFKKYINYSMTFNCLFSCMNYIKATIVISTTFSYFNVEALQEIRYVELRKLDPKNFEKWIICFSELQQRLEQDW